MENLAQVPQAQQFSAVVLCTDLKLTVKPVTRGWFSLGHSTSADDKGLRKIASNAKIGNLAIFANLEKSATGFDLTDRH